MNPHFFHLSYESDKNDNESERHGTSTKLCTVIEWEQKESDSKYKVGWCRLHHPG
uniref:Uncharacterized protein n=1 Tax=Solanum tuberosum TaxID=4113 RepID=M1BQG5_SOLTU